MLSLECLLDFSFSDDPAVDGRDFDWRGGGESSRGGGDIDRLEFSDPEMDPEASRVGEEGIEVGKGVDV